MNVKTPDGVDNRIFHEEDMRPGAICRRWGTNEEDEWEPRDWFAVVSTPKTSDNTGTQYIREVFAVMRNCPHHVFQILTKRPGRAAHMDLQWPPNVWMGTSVEDRRVVERIDLLRECDAELLFISFEPLVGPVGDVDLSGYDWAIVGGESGPDDVRREMDHEWAREIHEQCRDQGVRFFFKQSSGRQPETGQRLTVYNEEFGVYEQRKIQQVPEPHEAVERARRDWQRKEATA